MLFGMDWRAALLIALAAALSSTVLVFRGLAELGQLEAPAGRRAVGILLFQDVALVPLILLDAAAERAGRAADGRGVCDARREGGAVPRVVRGGEVAARAVGDSAASPSCAAPSWCACSPL